MYSKGKHSHGNRRPNQAQPGPRLEENTLMRQEFCIERKEFQVVLKENARGRFLRIVEFNGKHHASIMIPASGLVDFQQQLNEMVEAEKSIPAKSGPA